MLNIGSSVYQSAVFSEVSLYYIYLGVELFLRQKVDFSGVIQESTSHDKLAIQRGRLVGSVYGHQ